MLLSADTSECALAAPRGIFGDLLMRIQPPLALLTV